jgi:beta-glucosidase
MRKVFMFREGQFKAFPKTLIALLALTLGTICGANIHAQTRTGVEAVTGNATVDKLLNEMTLDEKIDMIHGEPESSSTFQGQAGYLRGVPRLGIPVLRFADGPPGILTRIPASAPTCTMGLAATFSREDALENGALIAREARARGIDVALQPFINIDRDLNSTRAYNTFGEDPFLTGQMAASEIRGIQANGVMAQAKHFVGYDTGGTNVVIDPQTLHEIYEAPFAAAAEAGVSSIMCSYNKINGTYACGNRSVLVTDLKTNMGFKGFVTSDWGATHASTFIDNGLDLEMPGTMLPNNYYSYFDNHSVEANPPPMATEADFTFSWASKAPEEATNEILQLDGGPLKNMRDAVGSGEVHETAIAAAAGRILLQMEKFGLLDQRSQRGVAAASDEADAAVIRKTGSDAAVLLKNEDHVLPFTTKDLSSLAFIGPGAGQTIAVGLAGEKAVGLPQRQIGAAEIMKRQLEGSSNADIAYAVADDMTGTVVPGNNLSHNGRPGLERTPFASKNTSPVIDSQIDFTLSNRHPLAPNSSYTWNGTLTVESDGVYQINLEVLGCYGLLRIDDKKIISNGKAIIHGDITQAAQDDVLPTTDGLDNLRAYLDLSSGTHTLSVSIIPDTSNAPVQVRLNWVTPAQHQANYNAAVQLASHSRKAVVFAWSRRGFSLPGEQNKLIEDIAKVNPNTVVVLNTSQPVAVPWLTKVKGVLEMWWPGDEGGWATVDILTGKVSPAGRLPFTWGYRLENYPAADPAHPERRAGGVDGKTVFSEGLLVGYRWFDRQGIEPLFPFGYGLSYTRFHYSDIKVTRAVDGGLDVSFRVHNTGDAASDEVPQVYLDAPSELSPSQVQFADRTLAAFDRIHLNGGESKNLNLHVQRRSLEYWSTISGSWELATGTRKVHVGASSRDFRLEGSTTITQ